MWTDGGLASTATDMARFGGALFEGRLLRPATARTMTRITRSGYGLGIQAKRFAGRTCSATTAPTSATAPTCGTTAARRVTVVVLSNSTGSSTPIWHQVAAAYDRVAPDSPPCPAVG